MPYYSELGIYTSPIGTYTGSYISGPYSNHSSLLPSNFTRPPPSLLKPRTFRGYKPHLATITETHNSLQRVNSPKLRLHNSPKVVVAKPIKINTADIDVSVNKYRKYERPKPLTEERKPPNLGKQSPKPEEKEAVPQATIRRDRPTVRLQTFHADAVKSEFRRWRDNFDPKELSTKDQEEKRPRKTPGQLLKEKFLIRSREDLTKAPEKKTRKGSKKSSVQKTPSFHDICTAININEINGSLNPGQPAEVQRRQSRRFSTEDLLKELKRNSGDLTKEIDGINQSADEDRNFNPRTSVRKKKKLTKKKSNEKLLIPAPMPAEPEVIKTGLQRRPTQKKIKRTLTDSSINSDISEYDAATEKAYQEAIRDISQVEIEKIDIKPKPIITATINIEEKPTLKAVVDDIEIVESPKLKKSANKFKFNLIVEEIKEAKRRSIKKQRTQNGVMQLPKPKDVVTTRVLKKRDSGHLGTILGEKVKSDRSDEKKKVSMLARTQPNNSESKKVDDTNGQCQRKAEPVLPIKQDNGDGITKTELETRRNKVQQNNVLKVELELRHPQENHKIQENIVPNTAVKLITLEENTKKQKVVAPKLDDKVRHPEETDKVQKLVETKIKQPENNSKVQKHIPSKLEIKLKEHETTKVLKKKEPRLNCEAEHKTVQAPKTQKLIMTDVKCVAQVAKLTLSKADDGIKKTEVDLTGKNKKETGKKELTVKKAEVKKEEIMEPRKKTLTQKTEEEKGERNEDVHKKIVKNKEEPKNVVEKRIQKQKSEEAVQRAQHSAITKKNSEPRSKALPQKPKPDEVPLVKNSEPAVAAEKENPEDDFWASIGRESIFITRQAPKLEEAENDQKLLPSKRSVVVKATKEDPDLKVFEPPTPPTPVDPEPEPSFVPLRSNRISQFMNPFKKPEQLDVCPVEIFATPKWIRKRHYPRPRHAAPAPIQDSESSEEEEEESDSEDSSEDDDEYDVNVVYGNKVGASTSSNDSGFDSGVPGSRNKDCDVSCHKMCEKLTANLCGVNQKLIVDAIESVRKGLTETRESPTSNPAHNPAFALDANDVVEEFCESSTFAGFQKSGRITPPATTIPRFRKYCVEDFVFLKVLGKGSFGKVLLAELKSTEYYYAIKCLKKDVVLEDDDVECTLIERKVLALATKHPYLCHLLCTFQTESHLFFVMEYLNGGDLMFHIQQTGRFTEPRARFYGAEIVSGLKFLHNKGIVYRDLKLDNILLDFDGHVRIADFGMCKLQIFLDRMADTFCGTPDYMAPEIIKGQHYNQSVDWWSFGVLLYEMLLGQSPFSGCDEDELFWSICNEKPVLPRFLSSEAVAILLLFLEKDSSKRLGNRFCPSGDIQDQAFFKPIQWDRLEARLLEPPFKPNLQHPLDTQYFDKTFTVEKAKLTPIEPNILQSMDQTQFQGFSYTNPNATDK